MLMMLPVADYGLFAYLLLALIGILRLNADRANFKSLTTLALVLSGIGTACSLYLQYVSFTVINAKCIYCITSAVAMTGIFLVQLALAKSQPASDLSEIEVPNKSRTNRFMMVIPLVALLIAGGQSASLVKGLAGVDVINSDRLQGVELLPARAHIYGDRAAPVTIVEFADLGCPSCQRMAPELKKYIDDNTGKIKLAYRHFLIDQHELSPTAAAMSEIAADSMRFWEYTGALMSGMDGKEIEEVQPIMDAAAAAGLDVKEMLKRVENPEDPVFARLTEDRKVADAIGVNGTPTFVVIAPGKAPQIMGTRGLQTMMQSGELARLATSAPATKETP